MKKLIFFLIITLSFAKFENTIINLIGEKKYNEYHGLIQTLIQDQNATDITDVITILKENGLIELFFDKPKIIHPKFIFINNNPIFNTKTLYNSLNNLGYYYFYPVKIQKDGNYSITLELQSTHHIDPVNLINEMKTSGCNIIDISYNNSDYEYKIDCKNEKINAPLIPDKLKAFLNVKGEYYFDTNGTKAAIISTSKYDNWHPYIVFYDKNLNIVNLIAKKNRQKSIKINIPQECKYIKIRDNYTKENIKRGIFIKGIK
jgi:hypothetical protein